MDSSPFASLPPELRNYIYTLIFTTPYAVHLSPGSILHHLTRTCRQLRSETLELYFSLTRFNAHLDDGPSTPLARWLTNMGSRRCLRLREVNIWDLHMLNATLHGEAATREMLREGPRNAPDAIDAAVAAVINGNGIGNGSGVDGESEGGCGGGESQGRYILRPVGRQVFHRGWYLKDVIVALQAMGLGLARFCIEQDGVAEDKMKQTSAFAIIPIRKKDDLGRGHRDAATDVDILVEQFGLTEDERESLLVQLNSGYLEVRPLEDQRNFIMRFDESRRLMSLTKDGVLGDEESYLQWI